MNKLVIAAIAALSLTVPLAHAQAPAAGDPKKVAVDPKKAAADPKTVAAVREMLIATNYRDTAAQLMAQMSAQMPALMTDAAVQMIRSDPELSEAERKRALAFVDDAMPEVAAAVREVMSDPKLIDEMVDIVPPLYARHFTTEEILELHKFYKTHTGAKFLRVMPQLAGESMVLGQKIMESRIPVLTERVNKLMEDMAARLEKEQGQQ